MLVCAGTPAFTQDSPASETLPPAEDMALARGFLEQLIEIDTTDTERGDNTRGAQAMADALLEAGLPPEDVHVLVPDDFPTKGNLVARLRGSDPDAAPILLLAHLDVVEALPEDWSPGAFVLVVRRAAADPSDAAALAVLSRQPAYNARLRTTCVATQIGLRRRCGRGFPSFRPYRPAPRTASTCATPAFPSTA